MRLLLTLLLSLFLPGAWAAHGYALWGHLKYPAGFANFDYVNLQAPRGGELRLVSNQRVSTFDKYNPFTIKGSAPAYLGALMFDTLLTGSLDETASAYGLLANDVEVAADGLSATFRLRPEARFHNGDPVLAADVKHSYDRRIGISNGLVCEKPGKPDSALGGQPMPAWMAWNWRLGRCLVWIRPALTARLALVGP